MSLKIFRFLAPKAPLTIPEGPITKVPNELVERCIFWADLQGKENSRLVCRSWNAITLSASKYPHQKELEDFVRLLIENLNKTHPNKSTKLAEIKDMLTSLSPFLVTPGQTERLFLITKEYILGVLKTLSSTRRSDLLQSAITLQIPPSLTTLFGLTELSVDQAINTGNFESFYVVFQNSLPLREAEHGTCVITAAAAGELQMLRLLLSKQFLTIEARGTAAVYAARDNHQDCVEELLADGPISDQHRGQATESATAHDNLDLAKAILKTGCISQTFIGRCLALASRNKNPDYIQFLFSQPLTPNKKD